MTLWTKYLTQVNFPAVVAQQALLQLQTPDARYIYPVGHVHAGQPNLGAFVASLEELWHVIYDRGVIGRLT